MPSPTPIVPEQISTWQSEFSADPANRLALNTVTKNGIKAASLNREAVVAAQHSYSVQVKAGSATSQNQSGRCWMFAGLNLFRMDAANRMNLDDVEFSQNYTMFWDKLEKSNYFLENILSTLDEPTDGRLIAWLCTDPVQDGGQWDMFVNLIQKYGVVPKQAMPETEASSATREMNFRITLKLRQFAAELREGYSAGASEDELRGRKAAMLQTIHRILCIHLGVPPARFHWQWRDKDREFHREGMLTPQQFREMYVPHALEDLVCLIHCPQSSKRFNTLYTVQYLGNVVGGRMVRYLNVDIELMKQCAIAMLKDGKPVWFGCDVGKRFDRDLGIMDVDLYDDAALLGTDFRLDKAGRLDYGASQMTHAMVFTGVDLDEQNRPRRWRVENSWGEKVGDKGFMLMTDRWFDEYNYEVAVEKRYLPAELLPVLDTEPLPLPPWDPMGALAL
jgi:bleomycin hydrolase